MDKGGIDKKTVLSFALYDWAASPLPTLHNTFIFAVYFTTVIMPDGGTVAWAWMTALASIAVALIAPFSGAFADRWHCRKPILFWLTLIAIICGGALWWVAPDQAMIPLALIASGILIFSLELSFVFYNALLPSISTRETIGRVSGFAWGFGYISAIAALLIALAAPGRMLPAFGAMMRDAPKHRSPNAGWPEAAMAAVLGLSLAGPRQYGQRMSKDPALYPQGRRDATAHDIRAALLVMWRAIALFAVFLLAAGLA